MTDDGVHSFQLARKRSAVVSISSPRLWKVLVSFDSVRSQRAMRPRSGSFKLSGSLTMYGCSTTKAQRTWKMTCSYLNHGLDGVHVCSHVLAWPSVETLPTDGFSPPKNG